MYPIAEHAQALATVFPPSVEPYPWGAVLARVAQAHRRPHAGSDVTLFIGRADFARFESFIGQHPSSATGRVGATHCQLRGVLSFPVILVAPPSVGGERA